MEDAEVPGQAERPAPEEFDKASTELLTVAEPRLRRAFIGAFGIERASEATGEALAWGWEHRDRLRGMDSPVGYLYRVGRSRSRRRRVALLPRPEQIGIPEIEPGLIDALNDLSERQRTAVWLVHACDWTQVEVAEALGISASAVATHVARGMDALRTTLEVDTDA